MTAPIPNMVHCSLHTHACCLKTEHVLNRKLLCRNKAANAAIILSMRTVPYISTYVYSWAEHTIIIIIATYIWRV